MVRAQHGQWSPKISLPGSETSHPSCFPWLKCRVPDWSRRIAMLYCHVSGVVYTVVQCLLPVPSRLSRGRRTCPGGMDNELWVDMTCASLGQMLPEPSCCSIVFLSPCHGSCMPGMGAAPWSYSEEMWARGSKTTRGAHPRWQGAAEARAQPGWAGRARGPYAVIVHAFPSPARDVRAGAGSFLYSTPTRCSLCGQSRVRPRGWVAQP